ncbi:hypothetical protein BG000_010471 [Podila horticola]|nr:hypothetical protein BG000_010471 [Podila horticola]
MTAEEPIVNQIDALVQAVDELVVSSAQVFSANDEAVVAPGATPIPVVTAAALTKTVPTDHTLDPFANGPIFDPERKGWRFQCVHNRNEPRYRCRNYSYQLLHQENQHVQRTFRALNPVADERTYRCTYHLLNSNGLLFRSQPRLAAGNIEVIVNGAPKTLVSRQRLQDMATRHSYSEQTMEWVERAIQSAADALSYNSDADLAVERAQVAGYNVNNRNDALHLQKMFQKYCDLLATGSVYFILYMNGFQNNRRMIPIKIGYTSQSVEYRIARYSCNIHTDPLMVLPRSDAEEPQQTLRFVNLLEKILHAVFAHKQYNYRCPADGSVHSEIFYFDPVRGIDDELEGARSRVFDLTEQLDEWVNIVQGMEDIHKRITLAYTPLKNQIEAAFVDAGKSMHRSIW